MNEFNFIALGACYLISIMTYFLKMSTSGKILIEVKNNLKHIEKDEFKDICDRYKIICFGFNKIDYLNIDRKYLSAIAFIPIINILFGDGYWDYVRMIKSQIC